MWGKALKGIQRVNKEEWDQLDVFSRWLIATRGSVLIMTFISGALGGLFAYLFAGFHWLPWALSTFGLVMAHATNNIMNDYSDYSRGVDRDNYFRAQYGAHPLEHGLMTKGQTLKYAMVTLLLGLIPGAYLVATHFPGALILLVIGLFLIFFYTWPLKYIGLGELAVLLVWGPLMIGGTFFVITDIWSWKIVLFSMPYALSTTIVIFGKHIDKLEIDKAKGINTLPVLLGEKNARYLAIAMMAIQYLLVIYFVLAGFFSWVLLIVLLAIPRFVKVSKIYSKPRPNEAPPDFSKEAWPLYLVAYAFRHNRLYGLLFMLGLIVEVVIKMVN